MIFTLWSLNLKTVFDSSQSILPCLAPTLNPWCMDKVWIEGNELNSWKQKCWNRWVIIHRQIRIFLSCRFTENYESRSFHPRAGKWRGRGSFGEFLIDEIYFIPPVITSDRNKPNKKNTRENNLCTWGRNNRERESKSSYADFIFRINLN